MEKTFKDIASLAWAKNQIEVLASKGIINGSSETEFNPRKAISRADFLVLLIKTFDLQGEMGASFADVPENTYYSESLRIARELGITNATADNLFRPLDPITREDVMVMTARAIKAAKKSDNKTAIESSGLDLNGFMDIMDVSAYAMESVHELVKSKLVHGYNNRIHPKDSITRAESAVLLYNSYNRN